jgi:hypothetical protein
MLAGMGIAIFKLTAAILKALQSQQSNVKR